MQWNMEAMSNYVDFNSIIVKVGRKSTHKLVRNSFVATALWVIGNSGMKIGSGCLLPQCQMLEYISLTISLVLHVLVCALKMRKKRETTQCDSVGNVSTNSNRTNSFVWFDVVCHNQQVLTFMQTFRYLHSTLLQQMVCHYSLVPVSTWMM